MAQAKLRRTRFRAPRAAPGVNRCKASERIPREPRAPMIREIEQQLEQLIAQFGEKHVLAALDPFVTKCKWNDWECVANAISRIGRYKKNLTML